MEKPNNYRRKAIKEAKTKYLEELCNGLQKMYETQLELERRVTRKGKSSQDTGLLDANNERVTKTQMKTALKKALQAIKNIPTEFNVIEKSHQKKKRDTIRLSLVSDSLYAFLDTCCKAALEDSLSNVMESVIKGAGKTNLVESSKIVNSLITHWAVQSENQARVLNDKGVVVTNTVMDHNFLEFLRDSKSASLILRKKAVTVERGLSNHSQLDVDIISTYKGEPRTTAFDFVMANLTPRELADEEGKGTGDMVYTFNPQVLSRVIISICQVPASFCEENEQRIQMYAKDNMDEVNARVGEIHAQLKAVIQECKDNRQ